MSKQKNPRGDGSWQQVAILLERVEGELKRVSEGHELLNRKIDEQIGQLDRKITEQFALVHQAFREHSQTIKQLTERFDIHQKEHAA